MKFASFLFFYRRLEILRKRDSASARRQRRADEEEEYRTCQRMPLGSFSRYMAEKHCGNGMDNVVVGSKYTH